MVEYLPSKQELSYLKTFTKRLLDDYSRYVHTYIEITYKYMQSHSNTVFLRLSLFAEEIEILKAKRF